MIHKLTDNVNDSFEFEVHEHKYRMRYPTVEEGERIQELNQRSQDLKADGKLEQSQQVAQEASDLLYGFVSPVTDGSPEIRSLLKRQSIMVVRHFNQMIKAEFSGS
jgi:hypothetical protein